MIASSCAVRARNLCRRLAAFAWPVPFVLLQVALSGGHALAQGEETGKPAEEKKTEEAPGESEKKPKSYDIASVRFGWSGVDLDGNGGKFKQYATPPKGWFLEDLRLGNHWTGIRAGVNVQGLGEDDFHLGGKLALRYGGTLLEGSQIRNRFFVPGVAAVPESERFISDALFKQQIWGGLALSLQYRMDQHDRFYQAPQHAIRERSRFSEAAIDGKLGNGFLSVGFAGNRYFDRTLAQPDTNTERFRASYLWAPSDRISLEGEYVRHAIHQADRQASHAESLAVSGDVALSASAELGAYYRHENLSLPVAQSASIQQRRMTGISLSHRWKGWKLQTGFKAVETERTRGDRSFVDVPVTWGFDGRISGRLARDWRLTLRGGTQTVDDPAMMTSADPRALFFDAKSHAQARIEGVYGDTTFYAGGGWKRWENGRRSLHVTNSDLILGATSAVKNLTFFVEFNLDDWTAGSDITEFPVLNLYAANSRTFVAGFSYVASPRTHLSATFTDTSTQNDNPTLEREGNIAGRRLSLQVRHRASDIAEFGLVYAPWFFRDKVISRMSYDASVLMLTGSTRF